MSDTTDEKKPRRKSAKERQHLKAVEATQIAATPPTAADVVYMAREFILCTLPHSDPGPVLAWSRTNGALTLAITTGINAKTGQPYGIPYGIIPRLLLVWIVTEITRTRSRYLELGNRFSDFLLKLGLDPRRGGKCSDTRRTREQIERLIQADFQFVETIDNGKRTGSKGEKIPVAENWGLWWDNTDAHQGAFWNSYIFVSERFFQAVIKSPNPLDIRVLRHIKDSSLGIDLYTILNRAAYRAQKDEKPLFLAWEWLHEQTGNEYGDLRDFRRKALEQITAILAAHPGLIISQQRGQRGQKSGLVISNLSCPSILPEGPRPPAPPPIEGPPRPAPSLSLVHTIHLAPHTVETFRARYPRLDPYTCQADFNAWQEGLPPEKKAKQYDKAFLGFAKTWAERQH